MSFLDWLFKRKKKPQQNMEVQEENIKPVELKDTASICNYVINICEQMIDISKEMEECIDTTFVSSVGKFVDRFEEMVAEYTGAKRAVVCVSGTNALHMAMLLAGVERDDEVLTQALTFIATCNAISYIGAHPVFIDVDRDTMGLSPKAMQKWLEVNAEIRNNNCYNKGTGRRIKCCVPMHTFGHPVHLDELLEICKDWHIELVEDAAESSSTSSRARLQIDDISSTENFLRTNNFFATSTLAS